MIELISVTSSDQITKFKTTLKYETVLEREFPATFTNKIATQLPTDHVTTASTIA